MTSISWKRDLFVPTLLSLLLVATSAASLNNFIYVTSSGTISYSGLIIMDFQNMSHFLVGQDAPIWTGKDWVLKTFPEVMKFQPTTEIVHSGLQAANLTLVDPSSESTRRLEILRDINSSALTDIWLQAWYYIPSGTPVDGFLSIHRPIYERLWNGSGNSLPNYQQFQFPVGIVIDQRSGKPTYGKPVFTVAVCQGEVDNNFDGVNDLIGLQYSLDGDFEVPFGRWFEITTYVHRDMVNGIFRLWFNGQLIWDLNPVRTIGILPERIMELWHGAGDHDAYASIGFSLYTSIGTSPKSLFVDDVVISNSSRISLIP